MSKTMIKTTDFQTARKAFVASLGAGQLRRFVARGCSLWCYRDCDGNVIFGFTEGDPSDRVFAEGVPDGVASVGYTPWDDTTASDIRKMSAEFIRKSIDDSTDDDLLRMRFDELDERA